jgi:mycofactocin precursor
MLLVAPGAPTVGRVHVVTQLTGGTVPETPQAESQAESPTAAEEVLAPEGLVEESLVEEVSIDGMCGVY